MFKSNKKTIKSYADFWTWFLKHERKFYQVVKSSTDGEYISRHFFEKIEPKLSEINEGIFYLAGMLDKNTVELVLTPEGVVENIVFVEELVSSAPKIKGWKFTALKPVVDIKNLSLEMAGIEFNKENISFYSNEDHKYPDEIDITLVHNDFSEANEDTVTNGSYIFLDNLLGELNFVTIIDDLNIIHPSQAKKELVPIEKLNSFLNWRQKEFIEKYEGKKSVIEDAKYSILKGESKNGEIIIASINTVLLKWDSKASHPWIMKIEIEYDGSKNNGLPDKETKELLDEIEDEISKDLKDFEGYLNVGRQMGLNNRKIYFACKEFRKPSKVLFSISKMYSSKIKVDYTVYKDKYWITFNKYIKH